MSRRKRKREERERWEEGDSHQEDEKPSVPGTLGAMLGLGVLLGWASIFAIPVLERVGVAGQYASNFPFLAFGLGAAWGLALRTSKHAREALLLVTAPLVLGVVFWFFGLIAGAALLLFGASEEVADYAPPSAFVLGALLGCVPVVVVVHDFAKRVLLKQK